jgi:hypothetical protein
MIRHFFILFIIGLFLISCKDDDTKRKYVELEKCNGNITAELELHKLSFPRGYGVSIKAGEKTGSYDKDYYQRPCSQKIVENAERIYVSGQYLKRDLGISILEIWYNSNNFYNRYSHYNSGINYTEKLSIEKEILANGISIYKFPKNSSAYVLPTDTFLDIDKNPILIKCPDADPKLSFCKTSYILKNNLAISYKLENDPNNMISIVSNVNSYINSLVVSK